MTAAPFSVVIVNWNGRDDLRRCLRSIGAQSTPPAEIVVVDNASRDDSLDMLRVEFPDVVVLPVDVNLGFAEGCNLGIDATTAAWVLTLNNDAELSPGFTDVMRAAAEAADDDVGMLQPRVMLHSGRVNSTGVRVYANGAARDRDFGREPGHGREAGEVFAATAGVGLYRRAMLDALRVRGVVFDPAYFMYFEDLDLGWRAQLAGWRAWYVPDAVASHAFQASSKKRGRHFVTVQCMRNRMRTLFKNASAGLLVRSAPKTARDMFHVLRCDGGGALARWLGAALDALRQRGAVTALSKRARREVESSWVRGRMR